MNTSFGQAHAVVKRLLREVPGLEACTIATVVVAPAPEGIDCSVHASAWLLTIEALRQFVALVGPITLDARLSSARNAILWGRLDGVTVRIDTDRELAEKATRAA